MSMQNRELGSGFGVVDIKFRSGLLSQAEVRQYGPNEYLFIKTGVAIKCLYIDGNNNIEALDIDEIPGLKEALADLPSIPFEEIAEENKTNVVKYIHAYHQKKYGGNEFLLFKDERYQGLINYFPKEKIPLIHDWIQSKESNKKDITAILDNHTIALVIPDILVDIEATRLAKILPNIIKNLPNEIKSLFSNQKILNNLNRRFINSLKKSSPTHMPQELTVESLSGFLSKDSLEKIDPEIMAYLIPAVLDLMEDEDLQKASVAIAKQLSPKDFRAIADENYFKLKVESVDDQVTLKNNRRTIAFFASNSKSRVRFRGHELELDHSHMHLEGKGEEREYKLYNSRNEYEAVKNGARDPNLDIVGEIHTVYKRTSKRGNFKYMAVAFRLKIGAENSNLENILQQLEGMEALSEDKKLDIFINYQKIFMPTLQRAVENNSIFFHSWASLKSNTHGFKAGLRFNIVPDTIEVSQKQYDRFKQLFGEMAVLPEKKILEPIDRKADHRQQRV